MGNLVEDEPPKDKYYRKYASGIERALSLFDTALQEWADYISFLNRLLKVGSLSLPEWLVSAEYWDSDTCARGTRHCKPGRRPSRPSPPRQPSQSGCRNV